MIEYNKHTQNFFAAANGYNGFRSNFDKIFSPKKIKKMFILKGGPGTGKSTLMKRIAKEFSSEADVTHIYCSSDPGSLDGVILSKNGVNIAIADGTAPHVIEPAFPGAYEEIINLGDAFDYDKLVSTSDRIISLGTEKKKHYQKAYSMLKIAGDIHKYINEYLFDSLIYNEAELLAEKLVRKCKTDKFNVVKSNFLVGSFSRNGYKLLPIFSDDKKVISVKGDGITEYVLTEKIAENMIKNGTALEIFPSAFSVNLIDAIETEDCIYTISRDENEGADSTVLTYNNNEYLSIKSLYDKIITESKICFDKASLCHFALEDIYSKNTMFEKNEEKYLRIITEIKKFINK